MGLLAVSWILQIAKDFAKTHPDTLIIVTPDHTHSGSISGVVHDDRPGPFREKVGFYASAGFPNDPKAHFPLFHRIPRGSSDWYWWIAYPDEFAFDYLDAHM